MPSRNAIVIVIDGLRASALGAYGNTWHPTPALDALASQSIVLDWMICTSPRLADFYESVWRGEAGVAPSIAQVLDAAGGHVALTTDDRHTAQLAEVAGFAEIRRLEIISEHSAATIADTELAQVFAVGIDQLESWAPCARPSIETPVSRLLWLHARGFHGAWDAPMSFRASLLDENDPPPPAYVAPPALERVEDHDELLLHRAAYAAQTMVLDECIGALMAALRESELDRDTLVVLVGARGFALGEHGVVGSASRSLYGELLHIPCLVRVPGDEPPPPRSAQLAQPADLHATLSDWFGLTPAHEGQPGNSLLQSAADLASPGRQFVVSQGDGGERAIRTPAWMLRQRAKGTEVRSTQPNQEPHSSHMPTVELYVKPDDRWEANEVADRCPDVAARLLAVLDRAVAGETAPVDADLLR